MSINAKYQYALNEDQMESACENSLSYRDLEDGEENEED